MATQNKPVTSCLLFVSLLACASQSPAQRRGGGGAHVSHGGGGHAYHGGGGHSYAGGAHHNANINHNVHRNTNVNVNHNVNVHHSVNVNHNVHWNGRYWGGSRVYVGHYAWPHGYAYVRRPVGWIMPRPFLTTAYYYNSWATLGLTAPPAHYQWVRYGSDLLLVDTLTGRVTDVRYGVFQ